MSFSLWWWTSRRQRRPWFCLPCCYVSLQPNETDTFCQKHHQASRMKRWPMPPQTFLTLVAPSLKQADLQLPHLLENSILGVFCPWWTSNLLCLRLFLVGGGWEETGVLGRAFVSNWSAAGASVAGIFITAGVLHLPCMDHVPLWMEEGSLLAERPSNSSPEILWPRNEKVLTVWNRRGTCRWLFLMVYW